MGAAAYSPRLTGKLLPCRSLQVHQRFRGTLWNVRQPAPSNAEQRGASPRWLEMGSLMV